MSERLTPLTDAWKIQVAAKLDAPGARSELARYLAGGDETQFNRRKVQIAKVFNGDGAVGSEFLLAVNSWLNRRTGRKT